MHLLADADGVHLLWGDSGERRKRQSFTHDLKPTDASKLLLPLSSAPPRWSAPSATPSQSGFFASL